MRQTTLLESIINELTEDELKLWAVDKSAQQIETEEDSDAR